jgi:hypothetical protein
MRARVSRFGARAAVRERGRESEAARAESGVERGTATGGERG